MTSIKEYMKAINSIIVTWMLGILGAVIFLCLIAYFDDQQEELDAEAYKQEAIQQAKADDVKRKQELKALRIQSEYMTGMK